MEVEAGNGGEAVASSSQKSTASKGTRGGGATKRRAAGAAASAQKEQDKAETSSPKKKSPPNSTAGTPHKRARASLPRKVEFLTYKQFVPTEHGDRLLTCGEGEQLGHPGRTTTKKPRAVDEEFSAPIVQAIAGGVHTVVLLADGTILTCGINEKGTVPADGVDKEGSTDELTKISFTPEIQAHGKMVMIAAGASFSAALTEKGSVIGWGNLRDQSGEIDRHSLLTHMQESPVVLIHHKHFVAVKIAAGENHLAILTEKGDLLTFGDCSMGQLGRSARPGAVRPSYMVDQNHLKVSRTFRTAKVGRRQSVMRQVNYINVFAAGFWTAALTDDNRVVVFGLNNFGQLGVPLENSSRDMNESDERELRIMYPAESSELGAHQWTHLDGVQHIVGRTQDGQVLAIGKNTDNALGLGTWTGKDDEDHWRYETLQPVEWSLSSPDASSSTTDNDKIVGVTARLGCSIAWTEKGRILGWGYDSSGQLGLGLKDDDDKVVPRPREITSAHLTDYRVIGASLADNHAVFVAKKKAA